MSTDSSRDRCAQLQHEIEKVKTSRKRKLCALYQVTVNPELGAYPSPKDGNFPEAPELTDKLAAFLDQNDIEKGRYLRIDTIPSRPTPPPTPKSPRRSPSIPSQTASEAAAAASRRHARRDHAAVRLATPPISSKSRHGTISPPYSPGTQEHTLPRSNVKEQLPKSPTSASDDHSHAASAPSPSRRRAHTDEDSARRRDHSAENEDLRENGMDVDTVESPPHAAGRRPPASPSRDRARVTKRKRRRPLATSLVLGNLASPRPSLGPDGKPVKKDYMSLLFNKQSLDSIHRQDLFGLLNSSAKVVTSADHAAAMHEKQACGVIKRVYDLQQNGQWPMRQLKPISEPKRATVSHHDALLKQVKWLSRDFREERKLKLAVARQMATWCSEWVNATPERRPTLQTGASRELRSRDPTVGAKGPSRVRGLDTSKDEIDVPGYLVGSTTTANLVYVDDSAIPKAFLSSLPLLTSDGVTALKLPAKPTVEDAEGDVPIKQQDEGDQKPTLLASLSASPPDEYPPDDVSCALFNPEWKGLRARVNGHWAFRPPMGLMPPSSFYENRRASLWTLDDDQQLRSFVKDFPANWSLISDRMTSRSLFQSSPDRRTPWECYERLLAIEGPPTDNTTRQYVKHFHGRLDAARAKFMTNYSAMQQRQEQLAQQGNHQPPQLQPPRFPVPVRVERKHGGHRYAGMLEGARRLAKKREVMAAKAQQQQQQQQQQAQQQQAAQQNQEGAGPKPAKQQRSPRFFSEMKFQKEVGEKRRLEQLRQQQRAMVAQAQAQQQASRQSGNQPLFNGISRMSASGGAGNVATSANGHLTVPSSHQGRAQSSHAGSSGMSLPSGMAAGMLTSAQMAAQLSANARAAVGGQSSQQRAVASGSGQPNGVNEAAMAQYLQAQAQQRSMQQQQQRVAAQSQMVNGNANATAQASNGIGQFGQTGVSDATNSPTAGQITQPSPTMYFQQAHLASGQVNGQRRPTSQSQNIAGPVSSVFNETVISRLRSDVDRDLPVAPQDQKDREVNDRLKSYQFQVSRQNALNAASGAHAQQPQFSNGQMGQQGMRPQSPYAQQQAGAGQQSPYQQSSVLASNQSPPKGFPGSGGNMHDQRTQQYHNILRAQMHQQQRLMAHQGQNAMGSPGPQSSPTTANAGMNVNGMYANTSNRTPTPANATMRPPSRSTSVMGMSMDPQQQQQQQQQRPGSAHMTPRLASQSPRPLSSGMQT